MAKVKFVRLLCTLILFLWVTQANAQSSFGLSIGFDNTKFSGNKPDQISYEFKSGLSLTALADFSLAKDLGLSVRLGYAQGGVNIGFKDNFIPDTDEPLIFPITDNYFNLATLARIFQNNKLYALIGPEMGYLLTSKAKVNGIQVDLSDRLNEWAFGVDFGFGLNFIMFKQSWAAEWQISQMLTTLTRKELIENGTAPKLRTTRSRLALIYKLNRK